MVFEFFFLAKDLRMFFLISSAPPTKSLMVVPLSKVCGFSVAMTLLPPLTSCLSGRGNRISPVCVCVCVWVPPRGYRTMLCTTELRCELWCTRGTYVCDKLTKCARIWHTHMHEFCPCTNFAHMCMREITKYDPRLHR